MKTTPVLTIFIFSFFILRVHSPLSVFRGFSVPYETRILNYKNQTILNHELEFNNRNVSEKYILQSTLKIYKRGGNYIELIRYQLLFGLKNATFFELSDLNDSKVLIKIPFNRIFIIKPLKRSKDNFGYDGYLCEVISNNGLKYKGHHKFGLGSLIKGQDSLEVTHSIPISEIDSVIMK